MFTNNSRELGVGRIRMGLEVVTGGEDGVDETRRGGPAGGQGFTPVLGPHLLLVRV
jgi:hypothetical protein